MVAFILTRFLTFLALPHRDPPLDAAFWFPSEGLKASMLTISRGCPCLHAGSSAVYSVTESTDNPLGGSKADRVILIH